ncbi:MAG: TM2 domain-containing protein [Clostridia bacterium]|nr:TM2 domain-containing protein [Clostridia bacterium]
MYHYYTDEPYKVKHTRERATHTTSTHTPRRESSSTSSYSSSVSSYTSSHRSTSKSSKSNDWLLFFLCLFLGYFGVHKFAEGKVGMGILYIFTVGLFYIGWFVDIVKYFKRAIN